MKYFLIIDESRRNPICGIGGYFVSEENLKKAIREMQGFKKTILKIKPSSPIKWSLPQRNQKGVEKFSGILENLKKDNKSEHQFKKEMLEFISKLNGIEPVCVLLHDLRRESDRLSVDDLYIWGFRFLLQSAFFFAKNKENIISQDPAQFCLIVLKDLHKFKDFYIEYKNFYYEGSHISYVDRLTGEQKSIDYEALKNLNFFDSLTEASADESIPIQIADFIIGSIVYYARAGIAFYKEPSERNGKSKYQAIEIINPLIEVMKKIYDGNIIGRGIKIHPKTTDLYSFLNSVNFDDEFTYNLNREEENIEIPF